MRTQIAKHLEHYFASNGKPAVANQLTTEDAVASTSVSPARMEIRYTLFRIMLYGRFGMFNPRSTAGRASPRASQAGTCVR